MKNRLLKDVVQEPQSGEWGKDDEFGIGIPVLRTTNFTNTGEVNYSNVVTRLIDTKKFDKKVLQRGDIIIEKSGGSEKQPVGRVIYFEGENDKYLYNNFTSVLRVKNNKEILDKYLFYYLFGFYKKGGTLKYQNKTTGLHNLKLNDMLDGVPVPIIDMDEQSKIINILDKLSKEIKLRQEQLELYDTLIKSRFVEMFENEKNAIFLEDGCLKITDFVASGSFASLKENVKYYYKEEYALLIRVTDFSNDFKDNLVYTDKHGHDFLKNSNLYGGELVLANIGASIGKVFRVPYIDKPMTLAPNSIMIIPNDKFNSEY
ncbi:MAG: restriction endonuclease subunit S, partial [Erysipelotrichales bacterium]|nr:restriction endonuclease subunit S [Erysipelotrichales bacterium]